MTLSLEIGKLFIVATPIGNPKDITLRALEVLQNVDAIICEEYRQGSRLLNQLGVENQLLTLNEHNETEEAQLIVDRLLQGDSLALISDAGTPIFADPGQYLLGLLYQAGVPITPIPGPSSLMAALSLCDFSLDHFVFAGFPPQKSGLRKEFLKKFLNEKVPVILMDTPYRLSRLLEEVAMVFGAHQQILLACDLTLKNEEVFRSSVGNILAKVSGQKREFILILNLPRKEFVL